MNDLLKIEEWLKIHSLQDIDTLQVDETLVFVVTIPSSDRGDFYKELFMIRFIEGKYRLCAKDGYDDTVHFGEKNSYEEVISFLTHILTI